MISTKGRYVIKSPDNRQDKEREGSPGERKQIWVYYERLTIRSQEEINDFWPKRRNAICIVAGTYFQQSVPWKLHDKQSIRLGAQTEKVYLID